MKLIIIQGAPATGKSTLTRKLAKDLTCRHFSKDDYKELRFDELKRTPSIREWFRIEHEARDKLYDAVVQAQGDKQFIIENCFNKEARKIIKKILSESDDVYEVFCFAKGFTSLKRFHARNKKGEWHKGHRAGTIGYPIVAWVNIRRLVGLDPFNMLHISEHTLTVDTADFSRVQYEKILDFIKN